MTYRRALVFLVPSAILSAIGSIIGGGYNCASRARIDKWIALAWDVWDPFESDRCLPDAGTVWLVGGVAVKAGTDVVVVLLLRMLVGRAIA